MKASSGKDVDVGEVEESTLEAASVVSSDSEM